MLPLYGIHARVKINHGVANCVCPPAQPKDDAGNEDHQGDSLLNPHPTLPRKEDQ